MIKWIKINNFIYQNVEPKTVDETGTEIWNIPTDPDELKQCIIDTLGFLVFRKLGNILNAVDKRNAVTTKGIVLLAKLVNSLNPDTSVLTKTEQETYNAMLSLADIGYANSQLLKNTITQLQDVLNWYYQEEQKVKNMSTFEEMLEYLENLDA